MQDVYGCIKSLIPEHQVTVRHTGKLESKCEIFVENLRREDIRITFWGDIARKFDMERVKQLSPPVLAVFTGLRLTKFQERVTAATTCHTCIIINPDIPIANEYKAEFSKAGDKVKVLPLPFKRPTVEEMKDKTTKSVFELNTLDPNIYMNKTVYCTASILRFPVHNGWWYRGCSKCFKQLKQRENSGELICPKHDVQIAVPCCKVYVTIRDDNNQATLILMGRQAEQLFGINCQDLVNKRLYPTEQTLPEEIKKTTDETYLFEITVNEYSELMVRNIFPSKQSFASMVEQTPTTVPPERLSTERKRNIEASGKALCIVEPEKKAKNEKETKRGAMISASSVSSSASKEQLQKEKAD
ncbi:putative replication protein A, OB [Rosa chinensis]|uniref:Putative replication protein A, OB n=1 Tax=Rosa chinensis TaxID=74649 RepID=A0A2P6RG84_ROSCH|nr:putative replication protein A, OB [Rosa chinensis]